ncbi:MAG TPA: serine hydrolase, partial [Actinomycetota bacterium]|nr:serine hydrolase [Actinomycetota bacterium]
MRRLFTALLVVAVLPGPATAAPTGPTPPPPTPVPPFGSPSPFPSVLETPKPSRRPPALSAAAAALADLDTGEVLWDRRGGKRRPVASLTKIMTVLFALEETTPLEEVDITPRAAAEGGAELGLIAGEHIPVRELLYALMLQSSNDAAVALAEHIGGSVPRFVKRMNRR